FLVSPDCRQEEIDCSICSCVCFMILFFTKQHIVYSRVKTHLPGCLRNISGFSLRDLTKLADENRIKDAPTTKVKVKFERIQNEIETANVVGVIKGAS